MKRKGDKSVDCYLFSHKYPVPKIMYLIERPFFAVYSISRHSICDWVFQIDKTQAMLYSYMCGIIMCGKIKDGDED